jgi:hypothetical protein
MISGTQPQAGDLTFGVGKGGLVGTLRAKSDT